MTHRLRLFKPDDIDAFQRLDTLFGLLAKAAEKDARAVFVDKVCSRHCPVTTDAKLYNLRLQQCLG